MEKQRKLTLPESIYAESVALLQDEPRGLFLDCPCGSGHTSEMLNKIGFKVYAGDIMELKQKSDDIKFDKIDLNFALPYKNCFFDYICCLEGIEHIENPHQIICEFNRILKPNGKLIISTPNLLNLYARLRYFLIGYPDWFNERLNMVKLEEISPALTLHISHVDFPRLNYILKKNNFTIEKIITSQTIFQISDKNIFKKMAMIILYLFSWLFIKLFNIFFRRLYPLKKELLSETLLLGKIVILKTRKI